jgi:hypothetical protein
VELGRGQVGELPLEAPEGPGSLVRLGLARCAVERERAFDPRHQPPGLAQGVQPRRLALARLDQHLHRARRVAFAVACDPLGDVARDPQHVQDDVLGPVEHVAVDLLQQVAPLAAGRLEHGDPGVVDQPLGEGLERRQAAGCGEALERRARLGLRGSAHAQRSAG